MSLSFDRFLISQTLGVAMLNAVLNAAYTTWLWRGPQQLFLYGPEGIGTDLVLTPVFIGLLSTLLGTAAIRRKIASGAVARPRSVPGASLLSLLPRSIFGRSAIFAIVCAMAFTMPMYLAMSQMDIGMLTLAEAVGAKVAITLVFSFLIVPIAVLAAGADGRPLGFRSPWGSSPGRL